MVLLSDYLEEISNDDVGEKKLCSNIINSYRYFGYPNESSFKIDLELLLETVYNQIILVDTLQKSRLTQNEFRTQLMDLYQSKCIISSNSNPDELEAAHIIEVCDGGNYDISNGLILEANLHKTFDKYQWMINPDTMEIEIKEGHSGSITKYMGNKINFALNPVLYSNLKFRYNKFVDLI